MNSNRKKIVFPKLFKVNPVTYGNKVSWKIFEKISIKKAINRMLKITADEIHDNVESMKIVKKMIHNQMGKSEAITDVELKQLIEQMKDNLRIVLFIAIGITPGSVITLPILLKIAKKLNIELKVTKTYE